jgi:glycosyltransferase involved in cell wall biosynthesis
VIERYQCGVVINPGDVEAVVAAITMALTQDPSLKEMRLNARRAATEVFAPEIQCARLVSLLEAATQRGGAASTSSISLANLATALAPSPRRPPSAP